MKKKGRTIMYMCRYTVQEADDLQKKMELAGYKSRSKFIRDSIFETKILKNRSEKPGNAAVITEQMMIELKYEIKKIGNNYNQYVKAVNQRRQNMTVKQAAYYTHKLQDDTKKMLQAFNNLANIFTKLDKNGTPEPSIRK
ncbi:MAG: hypothetical protein RR294_06170 [Bacilli bacterium]